MTANLISKPYNQNGFFNQKYLNKNQISNCILEIPQTINAELASGKPTLKAGSTIIIPDGFEEDGTTKKFIYKTIESDISLQGLTSHTSGLLSVQWPGTDSEVISPVIMVFPHNLIYSQETKPTATAYWYDTKNNYCYGLNTSGTITHRAALPFACFTGGGSSVGITWLDCLFNGVGFMASMTWVDKGVRCLFADERNADGTLKNLDVTQPSITFTSLSNQYSIMGQLHYRNGKIHLYGYGSPNYFEGATHPKVSTHATWYNTVSNKCYQTVDGSTWTPVYSIFIRELKKLTTTSNIIAMSPVTPINLVQDNSTGAHIVRTHFQDSSGYTIYSNGLCEQWGRVTTNDGDVPVTFLLPMADVNYKIGQAEIGAAGYDQYVNGYRFVNLTTTGFTVSARNNGLKTCCWSIKGRMAQNV